MASLLVEKGICRRHGKTKYYLLLNRKGVRTQTAFINSINQGLFEIFNLKVHNAPRIAELMEKYADLPMDLADASLIILANSRIPDATKAAYSCPLHLQH